MDGWEFRRTQQADPELARVPVIVLSALDPSRAAHVDAAAFLQKPLDFDRLLQLVRLRQLLGLMGGKLVSSVTISALEDV